MVAGPPIRTRRSTTKGKPSVTCLPNKHKAKGKTTELSHSNVPPTILERGVICERYELRWSLNAAAIRRFGFGGPAERDEAARRYLMALGLAARVLAHEDGYALAARAAACSPRAAHGGGIGRDGEVSEHRGRRRGRRGAHTAGRRLALVAGRVLPAARS